MRKIIGLLLLFVMITLSVCSCDFGFSFGDSSTEEPEGENGENVPSDTSKDTEEPEADDGSLHVSWHVGYVGSLKNVSYSAQINPNATAYAYTDVITVKGKGSKITFTAPTEFDAEDAIYYLSFWTEYDGEWVLDKFSPNVETNENLAQKQLFGDVIYTYVTTLDVENIRFCYRASYGDDSNISYPKIYVNETEEAGTLLEDFETKAWLDESCGSAYYEILEGKKINFIGDSLFGGHTLVGGRIWPALLATKYAMPYENYGVNGCTLSACEGGANPIISRYDKMPDNDADIIVFEGGRNDFNKSAILGYMGNGDVTTYVGALEELIKGLKEKYPNAILIGVTFWRAGDNKNDADVDCNAYSAAMIDVCRRMGVACIDATNEDECGIRMTDKSFRELYSLKSSDVCHLNYEGMKIALGFFERKIAEIVSSNN